MVQANPLGTDAAPPISNEPRMPLLAEARLPSGAHVRFVLGTDIDGATRAEMIELLERSYDGWPPFVIRVAPREYLDWKLEGPHPETPSVAILSYLDDRLVAMVLYLRERARVPGRVLLVMSGGDDCTHPDYRGRGLFSQRRQIEKEFLGRWVDAVLSFSGNPTVVRARSRLGDAASSANEMQVLVRVLDARRLARERHDAGSRVPGPLLAATLVPLQLLGAASSLWPASRHRWDLVEVERFDERFDALFEATAVQFDHIKQRTAEYLNWRYADPRAPQYTRLAAIEDGRVLGYLVLAVQQHRGYVLDLLALPGRLDVAAGLLDESLRAFRARKATAATCWLPRRHPYRGLLRRRGFADFRQSAGASYRPYAHLESGTFDFMADPHARLHVTLGDSDWA